MMPLLRTVLGWCLALLLIPCAPATAQVTCNGGGSCAVVVTLQLARPQAFSMTLSATTTQLPALTAADFTAGFRDVAGPTLTIRANAPYVVTLQAALATWQYTGSASNPSKPASQLQWSRASTGPFASSASAGTLWPASGTSAPATSGQTVALFYRTIWQWTGNPPGSYALPVNLTLTSP